MYDAIVSLGPNCATKTAIKQCCERRCRELGLTPDMHGSFPFDWAQILDYDGFLESPFFSRESLAVRDHVSRERICQLVSNGKIVWCNLFTKPDGFSTTTEVLSAEFQDKRNKIMYLMDKFQELRKKRVMYVIGCDADVDEALATYRGNRNFTLLRLHAGGNLQDQIYQAMQSSFGMNSTPPSPSNPSCAG